MPLGLYLSCFLQLVKEYIFWKDRICHLKLYTQLLFKPLPWRLCYVKKNLFSPRTKEGMGSKEKPAKAAIG